jgi:hypothetical protein
MSLSFTQLADTLATATGPHLYWIASRAAGSAALILSSVSVCSGLLMGGRVLKRRWPDLRVTHEALSLATLAALAVHGLTLIGDPFLHRLRRTGVATSGIGRRSWLDADGRPAHHLLDPSTGSPAFTGIVQETRAYGSSRPLATTRAAWSACVPAPV